jgi:protein-serine/threonine kinase
MGLYERRKEYLRARWYQNETDCLREKRQKVDVSAFVKLKTVEVSGDYCPNSLSEVPSANVCTEKTLPGHSVVRGHPSCRMLRAFGVVSLVRERTTGKLFATKLVRVFLPERYLTLRAVFVCPVSQDGYAADSEGPGGPRSHRV